jgi:hypothetical protein
VSFIGNFAIHRVLDIEECLYNTERIKSPPEGAVLHTAGDIARRNVVPAIDPSGKQFPDKIS